MKTIASKENKLSKPRLTSLNKQTKLHAKFNYNNLAIKQR